MGDSEVKFYLYSVNYKQDIILFADNCPIVRINRKGGKVQITDSLIIEVVSEEVMRKGLIEQEDTEDEV